MNLPSSPEDIRSERTRIDLALKQLEAQKIRLEGERKAIQSLCSHQGWSTDHTKCLDCGFYKET